MSKRYIVTYGMLPHRDIFSDAFDAEVPTGVYAIAGHRDDGTAMGDGLYLEKDLWKLVSDLVLEFENGKERSGENASVILEILGIEWV